MEAGRSAALPGSKEGTYPAAVAVGVATINCLGDDRRKRERLCLVKGGGIAEVSANPGEYLQGAW